MPRLPAELIPRIPAPVRAVARNAVWTYGRATAALRPLPDFLIVGAQRAGTTALYAYLRRHPAIAGPPWKEVSFFDRHYARGERWYRGHFPSTLRLGWAGRREGDRPRVGEASPSYLFHPLAPERAAAVVPGARLVALLRDPVERAFSHYRFEVALGREPLAFEQALDAEEERTRADVERMRTDPAYVGYAWWNFSYLGRGRYAEQLERWLARFPREQLLVLTSEDLFADPGRTSAAVLGFLGVRDRRLPRYPRLNAAPSADLVPAARERLRAYFAGPNRELYELLGRDLGWDT
ncbi:MAG: sulfotransferase [Thermoleophilia bacterium]|nr:sulfotransferase [Thermoleophilia bacterium]